MLKKILIPITLLIILMPIVFAYGNGYLFTGDYYGTSKWVYNYRSLQGVRLHERGTDDMRILVSISDDGKMLYLALYSENIPGINEELTLPIKLLHKNKGIILVKARYDHSETSTEIIESGRDIVVKRTYEHYRYVVTLVIRGRDYQLCRMIFFMSHSHEESLSINGNQGKHSKYIEVLRLVFSGET